VLPEDKAPIEEERRLFYVAMTRARETLTVSHTDRAPPSRFLSETPALKP
jgi:superfamily I DNA/RNA helicase